MNIDFKKLIAAATEVVGDFQTPGCVIGCEVAAAILSPTGEVFTGVSVEATCGVGFCAEHAAVAEMLKKRQTKILACVAVGKSGNPVPPCGRCRELMYQLSPENLEAQIQISQTEVHTLRELLPHTWSYSS